jgi:hypothetical protein
VLSLATLPESGNSASTGPCIVNVGYGILKEEALTSSSVYENVSESTCFVRMLCPGLAFVFVIKNVLMLVLCR